MAFGAPQEVIDRLSVTDVEFEVHEDNWEVVQLFMRLQTQWRASDGFWLGLIYDSIVVLLELEDVPNRRETFADLQIMEFAALQVLNEKKD